MLKKKWGHVFGRTKKSGQTLSRKRLVKCKEIMQNHKNTSLDGLKPFSVSYSIIWDDSYGQFKGIATHSQ